MNAVHPDRTHRGPDGRCACVVCREEIIDETMVILPTHVRGQFFFNCCEFSVSFFLIVEGPHVFFDANWFYSIYVS